ncbi:MAG: amidase family protein [Defluviitaleaceae bacterium]|nr:amidase family protein [Defluviitaleaceae bacterium]
MVSGKNTVVLEDVIMQKGLKVRAGSKILEGFVSPFTATVDQKLSGKYEITGRVETNEFCIGGYYDSSEEEKNFCAIDAVKSGSAEFALCNDIFGNYRRFSPKAGCCYIHPTYGTVSRLGLVPITQSMDSIGVLCKNIADGLTLLAQIAGNDPKDGAMFPEISYDYAASAGKIRIGIPQNVFASAEKTTSDAANSLAAEFEKTNIKLEYFDVYSQVMSILTSAEICNNISRYDGIKYGYRAEDFRGVEDLYVKTRTQGLGADAKLAAILGCLVLSQDFYDRYYNKAMKIRRLIKDSLRFDSYDLIVLPCCVAGELAALAGLPACSFLYKGAGIQLIANVRQEHLFKNVQEVLPA